MVGEVSDGEGDAGAFVDLGVFGFEGRFLAIHFVVDGGGLDVPDAALTPYGGGDFLDEVVLDGVWGVEVGFVASDEGFEGTGVFIGEDGGGRSGRCGPCLRDAPLRRNGAHSGWLVGRARSLTNRVLHVSRSRFPLGRR